MTRFLMLLAALMLLATPVAAQDSHAGHGAQPDPHAGHQMTSQPAADAHAGHQMTPPAEADGHAGHDMAMGEQPCACPCCQMMQSAVDARAGHDVAQDACSCACCDRMQSDADPHAGHQMTPPVEASVAAGQDTGAESCSCTCCAMMQPAADPHAGHDMGQMADPHAGHRTAPPVATDPHAGHTMSPANDPHAGHAMGPPDTPTGADNPGRPAQTPPPPEAFTGPAHAADTIFGTEVMAPLREQVRREVGEMITTSIFLDRLEAGIGDDDTAWLWDASGWIGGDVNRFYWKSEGEGDSDAGLESVEVQALYSRAIRPYWDLQVGVRQDFVDDGDDTTHLAVGIQGLAPGFWEVDAAAFLSTEGDLTARVEAEWDVRLTQRLILQPRAEVDLSASEDAARGLASGFTGVEAGLRLRYEIRREFAPYVGVEWHSALGGTADLARASGHPVEETRFLIGLRAWY